MPDPLLVSVLARSILSGEPDWKAVAARCRHTLGRTFPWVPLLGQRYVETFAGRTRPRHREVVQFLLHDEDFRRAWQESLRRSPVKKWLTEPQKMQPVTAAEAWEVPRIESAGALADWLWLEPGELDWFADLKGLSYCAERPQVRHYHYRILTKQSGSVRLIEAPKPLLKKLQRQILEWILDKIPAHAAVHGFVRGRSIQTFAVPHVGQRIVIRIDVKDFFPSFPAARIQALFRTAGYPETVADLLGGICTTVTPRDVWNEPLYNRPHLPQGAPSSPAIANLCTYRVDCRLAGLAQAAEARYTRYADDLAFSGGDSFARHAGNFATHAAAILLEEGLHVHHGKTRIMRQ
jgi:RNA-directed DNA polymerase